MRKSITRLTVSVCIRSSFLADRTLCNSPSTDSTEQDSSRNACTSSPRLGEPAEPLDGRGLLALQEPVAIDGATCHPAYVKDGTPLTAGEAVRRYVEERHGENTSVNRYGFARRWQWHNRQNYARGEKINRQLLAEYENLTTALLSLQVERAVLKSEAVARAICRPRTPTPCVTGSISTQTGGSGCWCWQGLAKCYGFIRL